MSIFCKEIVCSSQFEIIIKRLSHQIIERYDDFNEVVLLGIQPRGSYLLDRVFKELSKILPNQKINKGYLDVTFYRDDYRRNKHLLLPNKTEVDFIVEGKKVILFDDVMHTGRTVRAAFDALLAFGRPALVELMVFINRRYQRHLPIKFDYVGKSVNTFDSQRVEVKWKELDGEDSVKLCKKESGE